MSSLILGGTLFISLSNPAFFQRTGEDVWFSNPQAISAQPLNRGLMIRPKDSSSGLQSLGLDDANPSKLVRIQNVSDTNYAALSICPLAPVEAQSLGLIVSTQTSDLLSAMAQLHKCGFEQLRLREADLQNRSLLEMFSLKESEALAKGHRILSSGWENGRRILHFDETQIRQASSLLLHFGALAAFTELRSQKAPRPGNTLIFEVTLFEFFRNAASKIGVSWPESFRILNLEGSPFKKLSTSLELGLDFGESQGVSKVLARPQIRVKAGQKARFQSGGELPVQIITETTQNTQWKAYGLILDLAVPEETVTGADEISVDFKVELSEPDLSRGTDSIPGLIVRRLESRFDLRSQETTVLSTMLQTRSGALRSGITGLSRTPVLKQIFSSKSQQEQESELWFAIRPRWDEIPWEENEVANAKRRIQKL